MKSFFHGYKAKKMQRGKNPNFYGMKRRKRRMVRKSLRPIKLETEISNGLLNLKIEKENQCASISIYRVVQVKNPVSAVKLTRDGKNKLILRRFYQNKIKLS